MATKRGNKSKATNAKKVNEEVERDGRSVLEQPETTPEIIKEGHEAKVQATDDTRVSMDELNGDNIVEKLTDNPVARSNRGLGR